MIYSHFVEVLQHAEDVAGERLDAVLAEVPAKNERENRVRERFISAQK